MLSRQKSDKPFERKALFVHLLAPEDFLSLAVFLEEKTGGIYSREFWGGCFRRWWDFNPAMLPGISRGWLLKDEDGRIQGVLGNIPVRYFYDGKEEVAFATTSWFVSDEARNRGLDLFIPFMKQTGLLLDTTASSKVQQLLPRLGFSRLERTWLEREAIFIGAIAPFCLFFVEKHQAQWRRVISSVVVVLSVPLLFPLLFWMRTAWLSFQHGYDVTVQDSFPEEYETLWKEVRLRNKFLAVRRPRELAWFFHDQRPVRNKTLVLGLRQKGVLHGYAAFKMVRRKFCKIEYTCFEMADFVMQRYDVGAVAAILQKIYSFAKEERLVLPYIKMYPVSDSGIAMERLRCFWQKARDSFWYKDNRPQGSGKGDVASGLFATPLDGDRPFFSGGT